MFVKRKFIPHDISKFINLSGIVLMFWMSELEELIQSIGKDTGRISVTYHEVQVPSTAGLSSTPVEVPFQ
jgi:hypothetical protein